MLDLLLFFRFGCISLCGSIRERRFGSGEGYFGE